MKKTKTRVLETENRVRTGQVFQSTEPKKVRPRLRLGRSSGRTSDGIQVLDRMRGKSSKLEATLARARMNAAVAQLIYDAREQAGLTQEELAQLVGTKQPVIARLEDADYGGHSLTMLQRIATALHRRLELRLSPVSAKKAA